MTMSDSTTEITVSLGHLIEMETKIRDLEAQLPDEMQGCTVLFKECEKGHGRLTATNWVQHECLACESLEQQIKRQDLLRWMTDKNKLIKHLHKEIKELEERIEDMRILTVGQRDRIKELEGKEMIRRDGSKCTELQWYRENLGVDPRKREPTALELGAACRHLPSAW